MNQQACTIYQSADVLKGAAHLLDELLFERLALTTDGSFSKYQAIDLCLKKVIEDLHGVAAALK